MKNITVNIVHQILRGNPMREKTTNILSLCYSASTNLQFNSTGTHLSQIMRTPILSGTNLLQMMRTPILSGTNLIQMMRTPILSGTNLIQMMRTPILSELQLTLAPPFHPNFRKNKPFNADLQIYIFVPVNSCSLILPFTSMHYTIRVYPYL
jgi:hypothetical protein